MKEYCYNWSNSANQYTDFLKYEYTEDNFTGWKRKPSTVDFTRMVYNLRTFYLVIAKIWLTESIFKISEVFK